MILWLTPEETLPAGSFRIEWGVAGVFADVDRGVRCRIRSPGRWLAVLAPVSRVWATTRLRGRVLLWLRPHPAGLPLALEALTIRGRAD